MTDFWRRLHAALTNSGPGYDLPTRSEADLRAAFTTLADRYEEIADKARSDAAKARAMQISQAATDIRTVLSAGRIPHWLMTDAELEQYGTPEEAAR